MNPNDPYGLAAYGAGLNGAKLHKKEKRLEVNLTGSRLIDAREAQEIASTFLGAVPGCRVDLSLALAEDIAPREGSEEFFLMLAESWMYFSPLMRVSLKNAAWEMDGTKICVRIPEKLYHAAKSYNGADMLCEFVKGLYGM